MKAGELVEKVAFDAPVAASDGYGGTETFSEQFQVRAAYLHLRGGEGVQAARLAGTHTVVIKVRASSDTRQVTSDWRVRDVRTGAAYQVRDVTPSLDRMSIDVLCQTGVAT